MADSMPHTYLYNGEALCWCGEDHPDPDGRVGDDKVGAVKIAAATSGFWQPMTAADLDALYLEAWLSE